MFNNPIIFTDVNGDTEYIVTITINEKTGNARISVKRGSNTIAYGKYTEEADSWSGGYTRYYNYYDYATITVRFYNPETDTYTTEDPVVEVYTETKAKDSEWFVPLGAPEYGETKAGAPRDPEYHSDQGVYRSGGFNIKGGGSGPVGQDYSDNIWGEFDKDLLDALGKVSKTKYYKPGSGTWRDMDKADSKKWYGWLKKFDNFAGKLDKIQEELTHSNEVTKTEKYAVHIFTHSKTGTVSGDPNGPRYFDSKKEALEAFPEAEEAGENSFHVTIESDK